MKKYKPGQFVSIDGKLARVTIAVKQHMLVCSECKISNKKLTCIDKCAYKCVDNLPHNCYPKLIKQCRNKSK